MQRELNTAEVERLFVGAVDDALTGADAQTFQELLASDAQLKVRFEKYSQAVKALKEMPREKAPASLASMILRRTKRRRSMFRSMAQHEASYRIPVEIIIPLVIAALVAVFLLVAAR